MNVMEMAAIEGESPVIKMNFTGWAGFPSNAGHVKSCMNQCRPRHKAKYLLVTDSELVPRGKGEKNLYERSEIVPEIASLQSLEGLCSDLSENA